MLVCNMFILNSELKKILLVSIFSVCLTMGLIPSGRVEKKDDTDILILTDEEKQNNWEVKPEYGIKFRKMPFFENDRVNFVEHTYGVNKPNSPIYRRIDCVFILDKHLDTYADVITKRRIQGNKSLSIYRNIVLNNAPIIYSISVIRTETLKKYSLQSITKMQYNHILSQNDVYTHVFSVPVKTENNLTKKEIQTYNKIYSQLEDFKKTIFTCTPGTAETVLTNMDTLKFNATDLNNNTITETYFKKHTLTLINYTDLSEPMCRIRLNQIIKVTEDYPKFRLGKINIIANKDLQNNKDAQVQKILRQIDSEFTNISNGVDFDQFTKYLTRPSLLFFVNRKGEILEPIITNNITEKQLEEIIEDLLKF